ncbi:hypothetical protein QBC46DRAFT_370317 [Diplogelasinospora grovesii]|uniref:Spray n=1 Tax=Diplogelasinospora grovesii TaxID=303347 RepID=A0AAN6NI11_9PEZI|nr:hypothetical protein QBC46DRAFT_370317 [Diplogelasinospora grovesii]
MDYSYSGPPRRPRQPLHSGASSNSLSRISTVSDITDFEGYVGDGSTSPIRPRPSLVSLQSSYDGNSGPGQAQTNYESSRDGGQIYTSPQVGWAPFTGYTGYTGTNGGYEPVATVGVGGGGPVPTRKQSRPFVSHAMSLRRQQQYATIPEEENGFDLGLIKSAAPIATHEEEVPLSPVVVRDPSEPAFDLSSVLGPTTKADEAFMRRLQEEEAQGKLTGGLGLGIRTETTLTASALISATSPMSERAPLGRSFSRVRQPGLGRTSTVKQLAQSEADKRGEVIEVILEDDIIPPAHDPSDVDISDMTGPNIAEGMRQSTFPTKRARSQVFYPQPDWKPFSMRSSYLLTLIVLSMGLGGAQEVLYQTSLRGPLVKFNSPSEIPTGQYFAFKFLPTLIAVSYGVLWQITDFEVKRLEAFYQLSKEGGALAAESINVDYITNFNFLRPFQALHCKHYAVAVSSIASLLATALVPTLGAAAIYLYPDRDTRRLTPDGEKQILISAVWSRMLTTVLFVIAFLGCILFYQLKSRKSGLLSDVKGIAGLASMATVAHILMDFKDMDVATHKDIHQRLKNHRYVLRNSALAPDDAHPPSKQERERYTSNSLSENPQPLMLRAKGAVPFIVGIALFLCLVPIFLFTPATVVTDRAPWFVTALAVCIKLSWGSLETDVRMMEPYYILSRRHAPPKTLTLDYTAMPFGWVAFQGLKNGHWLVFFVGFGTVMTEILTILVTSLATVEGRDFITQGDTDINAGQETVVSFWISLGCSAFILTYMGIVASITFARRQRVFLPRQPNTIASVLAYIHQSKMLYDFVNTSKLNNAEMTKRLEELNEGKGKTYGLGWFQGRDGQSHCGVDEEELLSGYKFGYDYSRATKPWEETVEWL